MKNTFLSYIQSANYKLIFCYQKIDWIEFKYFFLASHHSTSVLTLPFNHFLCDYSASCFLYFVRLECNMLEVYTGSPMQLDSSEPGFHLKPVKQKVCRKWRQRRREKVVYISEVTKAVSYSGREYLSRKVLTAVPSAV